MYLPDLHMAICFMKFQRESRNDICFFLCDKPRLWNILHAQDQEEAQFSAFHVKIFCGLKGDPENHCGDSLSSSIISNTAQFSLPRVVVVDAFVKHASVI